MRVLVTGAAGFIGKNLLSHLSRREDVKVATLTRESPPGELPRALAEADFVFHLAGVNRPADPAEFRTGNADLTRELTDAMLAGGRRQPLLYTSSTQAQAGNAYGASKLEGERIVGEYGRRSGALVHVFRLPNVFGKWCRPNYNSAVATFCHNIARDLPIRVDDPAAPLKLVYIDDVIAAFLAAMAAGVDSREQFTSVEPQYSTTVGAVVEQIRAFRASRDTLITERVGGGLARALYATYVSSLPPEHFAYFVPKYGDARGTFVEMIKTHDSGQVSFFTAHPGITRGGHYHHTKSEKFLVIKGRANFRFRHLITGQFHELATSGDNPQIVETIPGWAHDITNVGEDELVVMLWANEIFDRAAPDTYANRV
jgi:UDP-2-acetamido-2,6-beta-L-arabino-hexul-4-ose reductase